MTDMHGHTSGQHRRDAGATLVTIVVALTMFAAIGSAILKMVVSASSARLLANNALRAFYLAESGGSYALSEYSRDGTIISGTFQLADDVGSFLITATTNANGVSFTSTGVFGSGTGVETRRQIRYDIVVNPPGSDELDIGFDEDGDMSLDDTWNVDAGSAKMVSTGPSGGEPALLMKGTDVEISMDWQGNPDLDLVSAWQNEGELLSYEVQVKIKPRSPGSVQGNHYMFGLSFRLDVAAQDSYGISFFRSVAGNKKLPSWLTALNGFSGIRNGSPHLVLWERQAGVITLMNHYQLTQADGVLAWDSKEGAWLLDPWSAIYLQVDEDFSGGGGSRVNHISAFVEGPTVYPRGGTISWDTGDFNAPSWNAATQPISDGTFTSANFDTRLPAEIGIHAFYDANASQQQFFDDFKMKVEGFGGSSSGAPDIASVVQY